MMVALSAFDLRIPACGSLKEKRSVVRTLTTGLRGRFNVAVAEVDHQDLWQRATLGVSAVAAEGFQVKKVMRQVERYLEGQHAVEVLGHQMTIHGPED